MLLLVTTTFEVAEPPWLLTFRWLPVPVPTLTLSELVIALRLPVLVGAFDETLKVLVLPLVLKVVGELTVVMLYVLLPALAVQPTEEAVTVAASEFVRPVPMVEIATACVPELIDWLTFSELAESEIVP